MPEQNLTVTDNRTGKSYQLPVANGAVRAMELRQIKTSPDDFGMISYDPAFTNTAACESRITFIDGDRGILLYRGYPIEQLAQNCTFLEVAWLLLEGELPGKEELAGWTKKVNSHRVVYEKVKRLLDGFPYDAHLMGVLVSLLAALSTYYTDCRDVQNPANRRKQIVRLIAKMPTFAAWVFRHSIDLPCIYPDDDLGYTENFLNMLWKMTVPRYKPHPVLARALDVLFILHADHEQNCSTSAMRVIGSSLTDPYLSLAGAAAALAGPLHGGANEEVLHMIEDIGSVAGVPAYLKRVEAGEVKLMGFGHRVYKNYDPRARVIRQIAAEVFEVTGRNPKIDIALELERIALEDEYFIKRRLYPNVDFYSGIIYQAMGFPPQMFTVLFALARTVGWLAQWDEMLRDPGLKIARPRQIYTGSGQRDHKLAEEPASTVSAPGYDYPWAIRS